MSHAQYHSPDSSLKQDPSTTYVATTLDSYAEYHRDQYDTMHEV